MQTRTIIGLSLIVAGVMIWVASTPAGLPDPPADSFTIAVIPDTQGYQEVKGTVINSNLDLITKWIAENQTKQRIVFVSHVGDIVADNVHPQWKVAQRLMNRLHGKIPYAISVGNHDMNEDGESKKYQKYFGQQRFDAFGWYGGCFQPSAQGK